MSTKITVGPIIGKVTHDSARILIETESAATVTCIAKPAGGGNPVSEKKVFKAGVPGAFRLNGLAPEMHYSVSFTGAQTNLKGSFRTLPLDPTRLRVAVVSCNYVDKAKDSDPWAVLKNHCIDTPGHTIDMLLHIGDQVYADDADAYVSSTMAYESALRLARKKITPAVMREIREIYRNAYRQTWSHPTIRQVLASVPNLMILDDHEVTDDWGTDPHCRPVSTGNPEQDKEAQIKCLVAQQGIRAYREYQKQLWADQSEEDLIQHGNEYHRHRFGSVGFMFIDTRCGRAYVDDVDHPLLTNAQWKTITDDLGPGGMFSDIKALVVLSPVPVAFLDYKRAEEARAAENDLRDHWSFRKFVHDQRAFVHMLKDWKEARNDRELYLVGGDLHVGGYTDICYFNVLGVSTVLFKQIISSPITNHSVDGLPWLAFKQLSSGKQYIDKERAFSGRVGFVNRDLFNKRNFALLDIILRGRDRPVIDGKLVIL